MSEENELEFSTVMFSTIHDIKNSLVIAQSAIADLAGSCQAVKGANRSVSLLQYELERTNNSLVRMLTLYKLKQKLYSAHIDKYEVDDFVDELIIQNNIYSESKSIILNQECDPEVDWFFDRDLIASVLCAVINNALRYAKKQILVSAKVENEYLVISVEDDGDGYTDDFIHKWKNRDSLGFDYKSQSTGLGLYFAEQVVHSHVQDEFHGDVKLGHSDRLSGAKFSLLIP